MNEHTNLKNWNTSDNSPPNTCDIFISYGVLIYFGFYSNRIRCWHCSNTTKEKILNKKFLWKQINLEEAYSLKLKDPIGLLDNILNKRIVV